MKEVFEITKQLDLKFEKLTENEWRAYVRGKLDKIASRLPPAKHGHGGSSVPVAKPTVNTGGSGQKPNDQVDDAKENGTHGVEQADGVKPTQDPSQEPLQ
ncbi:unnamed protein product [Linum trigynum]|uniref:Uncharacterized protein n=1 Tax=Linum trigynum TaxID=586398 RepID=A0AAV2DB72_9ROSI